MQGLIRSDVFPASVAGLAAALVPVAGATPSSDSGKASASRPDRHEPVRAEHDNTGADPCPVTVLANARPDQPRAADLGQHDSRKKQQGLHDGHATQSRKPVECSDPRWHPPRGNRFDMTSGIQLRGTTS